MRIHHLFVALAASAALAGHALADEPAARTPPPIPPTYVDHFAGEIVLADLGAIGLGMAAGGVPAFVLYPLASPTIHLLHHDGSGAVGSLLLHIGGPVAGAVIGYDIDMRGGCHSDLCGLGGILVGGALGVVTATVLDAALLARVERPLAPSVRRNLPTPTLALAPNGGVLVGVAGRL